MKRTGIAVLTAVLLCGGYVGQGVAAQNPGYDNRGQGAYENRGGGWDAPPDEFRDEIQRRGFRDGINGAQKDFENHRAPNVNNRDEYRHPHDVPGRFRDRYRDAFRRGYDVAVRRMMDRHDDRRDNGYRR